MATGGTVVAAVPQLDEGWIRAVLFERAIHDWTDLAGSPIDRLHISAVFAEQVTLAYQSWKWLCDQDGRDPDRDLPDLTTPDALRLTVGLSDWTELCAALTVATRAQGLLLADLVAAGDDQTRRAFDLGRRELAGHAALGFLKLTTHERIDRARASEFLGELVPVTDRWLGSTGLPAVRTEWRRQVSGLLEPTGYGVRFA